MTLCRSPLRSIPEDLASNLHSLTAVEASLNAALPDWKAFVETTPPPNSPKENENFAITPEFLANASIGEEIQRKLEISAEDPTRLLDIRRELLVEQTRLQNMFVSEAAAIEEENDQAARRKTDYTPVIYESIRELAEKGLLKEIVRDLIDSGQMKPYH
jgi:ubiquitin carboxyl-terminal hydrolase L5